MSESTLTSNDFYERLEIPRTAVAEEIKRAYQRKLRLYPPERAPEEFKLIREAYETLGNPETRRDYDDRPDPRAVEMFDRALQSMRAKDYGVAERLLKQVLLLDPDRGFVRNMLGLCYIYQGEDAKAADQFERLITLDDAPDSWFGNAAMAALHLEQYDKAEALYKEAIRRSDGDAAGYYAGIAEVYVARDRYDDARKLLEHAIASDGRVDFDDLRYFTKLLEIGVIQRDMTAVQRELARIERIATDEDEQRYLAWKLGLLGVQLVEAQVFEFAVPIASLALQLQPSDNDYVGLVTIAGALKERRYSDALTIVRAHRSFMDDGWLASLGPKVAAFCDKNRALDGLIPIKSAPPLWSINGIGIMLYGESERDESTKSIVKVLWFTILFVPVLPFARYRVIPAGDSNYRFLGRVRLSAWLMWWRNLAIAAFAFWISREILWSKQPDSVASASAAAEDTPSPPASPTLGSQSTNTGYFSSTSGLNGEYARESEEERLNAERDSLKTLVASIEQLDNQMESVESEITIEKALVDSYVSTSATAQDRDGYAAALGRYNRLIDRYNGILARRKSRYAVYKERLDAFNQAVDAYNARR
jgi:tetratricopeptide (TPR) repeat protein